jgi:hypothetical protein
VLGSFEPGNNVIPEGADNENLALAALSCS